MEEASQPIQKLPGLIDANTAPRNKLAANDEISLILSLFNLSSSRGNLFKNNFTSMREITQKFYQSFTRYSLEPDDLMTEKENEPGDLR